MPNAIFLMYHDISEQRVAEVYTIERHVFARQLRDIADRGMTVQTVGQYIEAPLEKSIVITFDDGHLSNLSIAAPLLQEFGYQATFFLTTGFIGHRENFMTWAQAGELANLGMELGTHGHTHRFLTELSDIDLYHEIAAAKKLLQQNTGVPGDHISAPGGRLDGRVVSAIRENNYRSGSSSMPRVNPAPGELLSEFGRIPVTQNTTGEDFARIIDFDKAYIGAQELKYRGKRLLRRLIGNHLYQKLWNRRMR